MCVYNEALVIRGVPIIGTANISATNMHIFTVSVIGKNKLQSQYKCRYKALAKLILFNARQRAHCNKIVMNSFLTKFILLVYIYLQCIYTIYNYIYFYRIAYISSFHGLDCHKNLWNFTTHHVNLRNFTTWILSTCLIIVVI